MNRKWIWTGLLWFSSLCSCLALRGEDESVVVYPVPPGILLFEPALFAAPSSVPLPGWISAVGYEGGEVGGITSSWHVAESAPAGVGTLWLDLDRSALNENLAMSLVWERESPCNMIIQLWDAQNRVVALDLFGNIMPSALDARTDTFIIPLQKYPSATRIVLRRLTGEATLYGAALIPVVLEKDTGTNTIAALQFARSLGARLSPENELVRRVRAITGAASNVMTNDQAGTRIGVSPARAVARTPEVVRASESVKGPHWDMGHALPVACGMLAATVVDGRIYALGGYNGNWNSHVFTYDPRQPAKGWIRAGNMPEGRACLAAVTIGGRIYSIGGQGTQGAQSGVYAFDPRQPEWVSVGNLPVPLLRHAAVGVNETIYVMGGIGSNGTQSAVYAYDTRQPDNGWRFINNMPEALSSLAATVLHGKIYVIGGGDANGPRSTVYVFDPSSPDQGWMSAGNLPAPRFVLTAATVNDRIYAVGGFDASLIAIKTVYMYDALRPAQGWVRVSDLPSARGEAPVAVVDGTMHVISGAIAPCSYQPTVFEGSVAED